MVCDNWKILCFTYQYDQPFSSSTIPGTINEVNLIKSFYALAILKAKTGCAMKGGLFFFCSVLMERLATPEWPKFFHASP